MKITGLNDLAVHAAGMEKNTVVAVVEAQDEHTLNAVIRANADNIIIPRLYGSPEKIASLIRTLGADPSGFEIIPTGGAEESLKLAIQSVNEGRATAIMKGMLESGRLMKAIVDRESGLMSGDRLSLIGFYETARYHKLLAVSDFGLNTYPDLNGKRAIIENAVRLLRAVGVLTPKVAVLSSSERVDPKLPDTLDADALKRLGSAGEIKNCILEGPISFDLATSAEAAAIKGYDSPVAGDADLLIVPDITAGNILVKALTGLGGAKTAGCVVGARVPVILTSRSAEAQDKYYSIALAACAAASY